MVDICLLGCGGMLPLPHRRLTSMLFKYNGHMVLVDCGEGTQIPISLTGWGHKSIDAICFTHYHADHIAGLPGVLLTMGNQGREEPVSIFGPPGLFDVFEGLRVIFPELPFNVILNELSGQEAEVNNCGDIIINSIPADHRITCLSYRLDIKRNPKFDVNKAKSNNVPVAIWSTLQNGSNAAFNGIEYMPGMVLGEARKGLKVGYCTDTRPFDGVYDFYKSCDLLICEGIYGEEEKLEKAISKKHMIFSEAAKIANIANVFELWLTHYSPAMDKPEELLLNATSIFKNTRLGSDLMFKQLNFIN